MTPVGVKASTTAWAIGNQYQNWVKRDSPTTAGMEMLPFRLMLEMVTFLPPASMRPCASEAPNFDMGSSCLSPMIFSNSFLASSAFGFSVEFC